MQSGSLFGTPDDKRLAGLAARQHGVVGWVQLRALSLSKHQIHSLVVKEHVIRIHRGVYAVGHTRLTAHGRCMAAVLACGPGAVLSHRAAAALHGLGPTPTGPIDVTGTTRHHLRGIRHHKATAIHPSDVTRVDGIPVTTVPRTLLDLAEMLRLQRLRTTLERVQQQGRFDLDELRAVMLRNPGRRGRKPLGQVLAELSDEAPWTQSELERTFLELIREHDLPAPQVNVLVQGELVDFYWPSHNLVVEIDGYAFHNTKRTFEADRHRDVKLALVGIRVVRFTYRRIVHEQAALVADLRRLLALPRGRRGA